MSDTEEADYQALAAAAARLKNDASYGVLLEDQILFERARRQAKRVVDAEERPPVEFPETLSLREWLCAPDEELEWLIEGWLPAGARVVLAGQAKAGKTTVGPNLSRSLVDGDPWLGSVPVKPIVGTVVVFDFEMTARQLRHWYRKHGIVNDDRVVVLPMRGRAGAFDLRDEDRRAHWAGELRRLHAGFVIWDCLRPVMDAIGLDENREAGVILTAFDALLADAGNPGALVVHHMGHSDERSRGDSRIIDWPDSTWKLVRDKEAGDSGPRFISAYGRDVDQPETGYLLDQATGRLSLVGGSRAQLANEGARDQATAVLADAEEPLTASAVELALQAAGMPRAVARTALRSLVADGSVMVQPGPRRSLLHRLATPEEQAKPPNRHSPPQSAGGLPASKPPPSIRRPTGTHQPTRDQSADGEVTERFGPRLPAYPPAPDDGGQR